MKKLFIYVKLLLPVIMLAVSVSFAGTKYIRYVNPDVAPGGDGLSSGTAYHSLVEWANVFTPKNLTTGGDTMIVFCTGTSLDDSGGIVLDSVGSGWKTAPNAFIHIIGIKTSNYGLQATVNNGPVVKIKTPYVTLEGLKIKNLSSSSPIGIQDSTGGDLRITRCVLQGVTYGQAIDITGIQMNGKVLIWNNFIYDWGQGISYQSGTASPTTALIYNNTIIDCGSFGINLTGTNLTDSVKNNLVQGSGTNYSGSWNITAKNISSDATSPNGTNCQNKTVSFINSGSDDFHLMSGDMWAKDSGVNLSGDMALSFNIDFDSSTRAGLWDIGADEYSAGGGGMKIVRYVNPAAIPGGDGTTNVTSGTNRAFHSLLEWQAVEKPLHANLTTNNDTMIVLCVGMDMDDSGMVDISGWTTSPSAYIHIKTPIGERHNGIWNPSKYRLEATVNLGPVIKVKTPCVRIEGLQIRNASNTSPQGIIDSAGGELWITQCILKGATMGQAVDITGLASSGKVKIWNNIIYDWGTGINYDNGIGTSTNAIIYNNTIINCNTNGINFTGANLIDSVKNNIVQGMGTNYTGSWNTTANNISKDASSPNGASYQNKKVNFIDSLNGNFHLAGSDTNAKNKGVDLSADMALPFDVDLDSIPRIPPWDIGAVEAPIPGTLTMSAGTANPGLDTGIFSYDSTAIMHFNLQASNDENLIIDTLKFQLFKGSYTKVMNVKVVLDYQNDGIYDPIQDNNTRGMTTMTSSEAKFSAGPQV